MPMIVDDSFLIFMVFVPAILMFAVGLVGGMFRIPKAARQIGTQMKKGEPIEFLVGHDRKMRVIPMKSGKTGYWREKDIEVIPGETATYPFYGTMAGIASTQCASNLSPDFLMVINEFRKKQLKGELTQIEDVLGRKIGTDPIDLAKCLYALEERKKQLEQRIDIARKIIEKKGPSDEALAQEMTQNMSLSDEEKEKFKQETLALVQEIRLQNDAIEKTKTYETYSKILAARKIEVQQSGWSIEPVELPSQSTNQNQSAMMSFARKTSSTPQFTYQLVRRAFVSLDDFWHFLPSGTNINAVWTMNKRASMADKLESSFNESQGFKWLIIGVVAMMSCIGAGIMVKLATG